MINVVGTGAAGYQWGVEADETGVNIESISVRYYPEVDETLVNRNGQSIVLAVADQPSRDITISGEVNGATGLMAAGFSTATSIANDSDVFGSGAGTIFLKEATESQSRTGWRSVEFSLTAHPELSIS